MDFQINGRTFRITNDTPENLREHAIHSRGFSLREWDSVPVGGRSILHDTGMPTEEAARDLADKLAA